MSCTSPAAQRFAKFLAKPPEKKSCEQWGQLRSRKAPTLKGWQAARGNAELINLRTSTPQRRRDCQGSPTIEPVRPNSVPLGLFAKLPPTVIVGRGRQRDRRQITSQSASFPLTTQHHFPARINHIPSKNYQLGSS